MSMLVSFLWSGALVLSSCATDSTDDDETDVVQDEAKEDGPVRPVGTFFAIDPEDAPVAGLILLRSSSGQRRFRKTAIVGSSVLARGRYNFSYSQGGAKRYLRLLENNGELLERYQYKYDRDEGELALRRSGTSKWFRMYQDPTGWCEQPLDCGQQALSVPECVGSFACEGGAYDHCVWSCAGTSCDATMANFDTCLGEHAEGCFDRYDIRELVACCTTEGDKYDLCPDLRERCAEDCE